MKTKLALLSLSGLLLMACGNNNAETDDSASNNAGDLPVKFISGVNENLEVYGDSQNYANIIGTADDISQIAAIDPESSIVHSVTMVEDGEFNMSFNMQGLEESEFILTTDDSVMIPSVEDIDALENSLYVNYIPNEKAEEVDDDYSDDSDSYESDYSDTSEDESYSSYSPTFTVGDSVEFESGLQITVTDVQLSDEEPNGDILGNFVRVDFTIDNQMSEPFDFNSHYVELYDGDRNKAEIDSKDFYSESIAPGMKGSGSVYFDSPEQGPFTIMIGDATWESE